MSVVGWRVGGGSICKFKGTHREKAPPKIKLQRLRKIRMLTFGSLVNELTLFKRF